MKSRLAVPMMLSLLLVGCAATPTTRSTGEYIDDSAIVTKIKSSLLMDPDVDGDDVTVLIDLGHVQLLGFVDEHRQRIRAEQLALATPGVVALENAIRVVRGSRRMGEYVDDKVLVGRVNSAMLKNRVLGSARIKVLVNRDVVLLGGFVNSSDDRALAYRIAIDVEGVRDAVNEVQVRTW